jgi:hypothetical protein
MREISISIDPDETFEYDRRKGSWQASAPGQMVGARDSSPGRSLPRKGHRTCSVRGNALWGGQVSAERTRGLARRKGGLAMFTDWDNGFDVIVGAEIKDETTEPFADSGLWDLLHGRPEEVQGRERLDTASSQENWHTPYKV